MLRQPRFLILAFFLFAITSNFIQAARISVNQTASTRRLLSRVADAGQTDSSVFVVPEDDSDSPPTLILVHTTIENILSFVLSLSLNLSAAITAALAERNHTVLRL